MSYLCLHFCLKVAAELSLQMSARIINKGCSQNFTFFFRVFPSLSLFLKIRGFVFQFCSLIRCSFPLQIIHKMKASFFFFPQLFRTFSFCPFFFFKCSYRYCARFKSSGSFVMEQFPSCLIIFEANSHADECFIQERILRALIMISRSLNFVKPFRKNVYLSDYPSLPLPVNPCS